MEKAIEKGNEQKIVRRSFLYLAGVLGLLISGLFSGIINLLFLRPEVSYGPPTIFSVGKPEDYQEGTNQIFENERVIVIKEKNGFMAVSLTCTHLGCTVRTSDAGFECPCHGSQFDNYGNVTGGPAPSPLSWYKVSMSPTGELEVNKEVKIKQGTFFNA